MRRARCGGPPAAHSSPAPRPSVPAPPPPPLPRPGPPRAGGTPPVQDAVGPTTQRSFDPVRKRRRLGQPLEAGGDPAAVLLGEVARFLETAARRNGEHDFTRGRVDAKGIAARLP